MKLPRGKGCGLGGEGEAYWGRMILIIIVPHTVHDSDMYLHDTLSQNPESRILKKTDHGKLGSRKSCFLPYHCHP